MQAYLVIFITIIDPVKRIPSNFINIIDPVKRIFFRFINNLARIIRPRPKSLSFQKILHVYGPSAFYLIIMTPKN